MIPLAHAGHWLLNVLYVLPVLIVLGAAVRAMIQNRRERAAEQTPEDDEARG